MMHIKVHLRSFGDPAALTADSRLELPDGVTVRDALRKLRIPGLVARLPLVAVNHHRARPDDVLHDGDVLTFVGMLVGG